MSNRLQTLSLTTSIFSYLFVFSSFNPESPRNKESFSTLNLLRLINRHHHAINLIFNNIANPTLSQPSIIINNLSYTLSSITLSAHIFQQKNISILSRTLGQSSIKTKGKTWIPFSLALIATAKKTREFVQFAFKLSAGGMPTDIPFLICANSSIRSQSVPLEEMFIVMTVINLSHSSILSQGFTIPENLNKHTTKDKANILRLKRHNI